MSSLKKKTSNIAVWIIMLLLIAGLGGFGVSNFGGSSTAVATVGDTDVNVDQYYRALNQELRGIQAQTGQPLSLNQAIAFGVDQNVRARLITEAALDNETARIGISVGDARVKTEVLASPAFQGLDGKFDRVGYSQALNQAGLNEAEYENSIRVETARSILQGTIVSGVAAPAAMTDAFLGFNQQRRNFRWIKLDQTSLPELLPEPTDAQLKTYYQENAADFTEPQKKRLNYVWVTPDMILDQIDITDEDLRKEYNSRIDQYSSPETRLVERLVFPSEEDAKAAKARLDAGDATFEELVTERGLKLLDIDLGNVTVGDLSQAGEAIFGMDAPGVLGPLNTDLGPALFRMNGILAAQETTFEQAREELKSELALDRASRQINTSINDIDDLLAGGASLADVAAETDMELASVDWAEGNSDGIASYNAFREAAAAVNKGDYAEVLELDDGGIFALEYTETIAPALTPMDQVIASVITGWENKELGAALSAIADDLQGRINKGEDFTALGHDVLEEQEILRTANIDGLAPDMMQAVFEMDKSETRTISNDGAVYLLQLVDILAPDSSDPDMESTLNALETGISQALSQDIFAAFNAALQNEAGVYVNSAAINAVHAQFPQ